MMLADIDYAAIPRPLSALPFLVSSRRPQLLDRKEKAVCIAIDSRGSVAGKLLRIYDPISNRREGACACLGNWPYEGKCHVMSRPGSWDHSSTTARKGREPTFPGGYVCAQRM